MIPPPQAPRRRRPGVTLIELLVAFALVSVMATLAWDFWVGASKQGKQIEEGADLVRAALLLQERMTGDLEGALPLRVLPPEMTPRGQDLSRLVLPLYAGYQGDSDRAIRYQPIEYRFDPATQRLTRDGEALYTEGVAQLSFRWTAEAPTKLLIDLTGPSGGRATGTKFQIQLPAPPGTDGLPIWRFAAHHRVAAEAGAP